MPGTWPNNRGRRQALPRRRHVSRLVMPLSLRGGKLGCNSTRKDPWVTKRPCGIRVMCGNAASSRANTWGLQPRLRHGRIPAGIRSLGCLFRLGTGTEPGTRAIQRTTAIASGRPFRNSASCACRPRRQRAWPPLRDSGRLLRALSARAGSVWKSAANEPLRKVFQCWENGVKTLHALYNKVFSFYGDEVISWRTEQTRLQPTRRASGPHSRGSGRGCVG
jgi:hypothetical protein